jgi:site-specific DNA-methyltransferase (adenine-specific)
MIPTNQIICGESSSVLSGFPAECIDLTVTSPPYDNLRTYKGYTFDFEAIATQLYRVTKPGGVAVWVVADATVKGSETGTSFRQALYFMGLGFSMETMIYKIKGVGAKGNDKLYWQSFEYMFIFFKDSISTTNLIFDKVNLTSGGTSRGRRTNPNGGGNPSNVRTKKTGRRTNVWEYQPGTGERTCHPAIFPEALARDHIISWSNPGDVVLDPFLGSGTTAKMCVETGRSYIGIDISPEYCELAKRRVERARVPLFVETPAKEDKPKQGRLL